MFKRHELISCVTLLAILLNSSAGANEGNGDAAEIDYQAVDHERRTIYHSPETPGFTCWVYAWTMPDNDIMVSFYQATGPKNGRPRAPLEIQKKLSWPHLADGSRDMTGLDARNVYLRSSDTGKSWNKTSEDAFRSPMNGLVVGGVGLQNGTILRALYGAYLPYDQDVPRTGLWQRSADGGKTWSKMASFLPATDYLVYPVGLRQLNDGRIALLGGVARGPADRAWEEYGKTLEPLLMISEDGGKTWGMPIQVIPEKDRHGWSCEECDMVELPNGNLFWVFRRCDPQDQERPLSQRRHVQWQGVMEKQGKTWIPQWVGPTPFANTGLPHLVMTREGVVLHVKLAHWTLDEGKSWHALNLPAMAYYPKGLQLSDGRILVFAHVGSDDAYGTVDQSIVMDSFRLKRK